MNVVSLRSTVLLVSGCLVAATSASGQDRTVHPETGRSLLTNFTPADYEANTQNWAVVEDNRGIIYVGNGNGVLEYDGRSWRLIPLSNGAIVRSLARDATGRIWVGGRYELGYLTADSLGRTVFVSLRDEVPEPHRDFTDVWQTHATDEGIYFRTAGAIFRWDESTMQAWPAAAEGPFRRSLVVQDTLYVFQGGVGLMRMERFGAGDALRRVPGEEQFANRGVRFMLPFDANRIVIGTTSGLLLWDGEGVEAFATEADGLLAEGAFYWLGVVLPNGALGLSTTRSQGLVVIDRAGRLVEHIDQEAGLQDNTIRSMYTDGQGNVWLALNRGITRVEIGSPLTHYDALDGLPSSVSAITRHGGELFAGVGTIGVKRLDPSARTFRHVEGPIGQVVSFLSVAGDLLVTVITQGVYHMVGDRIVVIRRSMDNDYRAVMLHQWGGDPNLVAVTLTVGGLAILRRSADGWIDEGRVPGLDLDVFAIAEASDGDLWLGTHSGRVARVRLPRTADGSQLDLREATVTVFGPEDGLAVGTLNAFRVGDKVYITGLGETVFSFDEATGRFAEDSTFAGARSGHPLGIFVLREDTEGRVWIASTYGAPVVAHPRSDGTYAFEVLHEFRQARIDNIYPEADGVVWLTGLEELIRYDQRDASQTDRSLPPLIRQVSLGEDTLLYGGAGEPVDAEIAHGSEGIRFTYAAPGGSGQLLLRTQLEGFDTDWSTWSRAAERSYTNLPFGDYRFRVEREEGREAAYVFTVLPPWYRTWGAYALFAVLLGLLLSVAFVGQRRRLIKKERESAKKKRIEDELKVGHSIQMGMLTTDFPILGGMEISAKLQPAREVGGDLYDMFFLDEQHLCCCVGDVSGKGVPAALFMAISKTLFKAIASHQRTRDPGENGDNLEGFGWSTGAIMTGVNDELSRNNEESMFVTAFLCVINIKTGKVLYTNAGHNPPYVFHPPEDPAPLKERHGPVLGAVEGIEYGEASFDLNRGEELLIFTDGVTEAFNEGGELFTEARLERFVSGLQSTTANETVHAVLAEVAEFEGDIEQTDDITILAVRRE